MSRASLLATIGGLGLGLVTAMACSANSGGGDDTAGAGATGSGAAGGSGGAGAVGGFGGSGAVSGTGGTGFGGFAGTSTGGTGGVVEDACASESKEAENKIQPADIIIAVDQSGSMDAETNFVRTQLNSFSAQVGSKGIDVHVILLASLKATDPENPICIDPPLGSGGCPTADTNPPLYTHVDIKIESHDAYDKILLKYDEYKDQLRPDSTKHIVVISDDTPNTPWSQFDSQLKAKDAALWQQYFFHAIVPSQDDPGDFQCIVTPVPCCGIAAGDPVEYRNHVQATQGVYGDLCLQDFQPVWDAVTDLIVQTSTIACEWDIPPPPPGQTFDKDKVNVTYTGGGTQKELGRVDSAADCAQFKDAWYYDDPANPTKIIVCPDICAELQAGLGVKMEIQFGCATKPPIPR